MWLETCWQDAGRTLAGRWQDSWQDSWQDNCWQDNKIRQNGQRMLYWFDVRGAGTWAMAWLGGGQRPTFPANDKAMASRGLGAAHGYALCEEGSCEAAEQWSAWRPVVSMP